MTPGLKPLGSCPAFHVNEAWDVARLWQLGRVRSEKNRPDLKLLSVFLGRGVIAYREGGGQVHKPSLDLAGYQVVYPGDLVLNNQQAWRGSVGVSGQVGIVSPAYVVFALDEMLDPRFANYLFQSGVMVAQFVTASKGVGDIQRDVHPPWLKNAKVPVPSRKEQSAIVRFLDHADRRIRRYIRAKQNLIKLLEEQKQAIVHRLVTRGLDPNVRLKPSGVDWLGDVPEHWDVLPIKRAFRLMDYGLSESAIDDGTIRLLTMGNIKAGRITVPEAGGIRSVDPRLLLDPGDLLFNRTNSAALVGKVGLFRGCPARVTFASYLVRMRPRACHDAGYLNYLLNDDSVLLPVYNPDIEIFVLLLSRGSQAPIALDIGDCSGNSRVRSNQVPAIVLDCVRIVGA